LRKLAIPLAVTLILIAGTVLAPSELVLRDGRIITGEVRRRGDEFHVEMESGEATSTTFGALDAFLPAVLALGGDLDRAGRLMDSVYSMWTTFDVEPESFEFTTMEVVHAGYPLRPEAIESAYYLFVLTGDERYRDMGRDIFRRIVRWTRSEHGFAHLVDVRTKEKDDAMESFFLAETLKYAYLLADPTAIDFSGHLKNFEDAVRALKAGKKPLIDGSEARKSIEIILAIYRSALKGGKPVQLPLKRTPVRRSFR